MKKMKKILLTAGLLLSTATVGLFGACGDKTVEYTFNTNGGNTIESVELEPGSSYTLPVPVREGYEFLGWYTTADFAGTPVTSVQADADQTYYAKWEELCKLTLNLDGGTLSEGTTLYLKEGTSIYNFMQNYTPTKTGMEFGAWYNGDNEISSSTKITKAGLTLTAKYKNAYTIELWTQKDDLSGYEKVQADVVAYEYAGASVTARQTLTGYKEVTKTDTVKTLTISENSASNVFKLYFDRETYLLTFNANYPDGTVAEETSQTVLYGTKVQAPVNYTADGYCFVGWATSKTGEVKFKANYIDSVLYNKTGEVAKPDDIDISRDTTLYGVWIKGIEDMFGNDDYLYLLDENSKTIYLSRGNVFFEGEYDADDKEFVFWDKNMNVLLEGKVNDNNTYTYYDSNRVGASTLYGWIAAEEKMGLIETTRIILDAYDGITYSVTAAGGTTSNSEGKYVIDENGFYIAKFTTGELANKTLTLALGSVTLNNVETPAFRLRNDEEYALGTLSRLMVKGGSLALDTANKLTLDGFGTAKLNNTSYTYARDEEKNTITLKNAYGEDVEVLRIVEDGAFKGFMSYDEELEREFTLASGAKLELNGTYKAKYVNNGSTINVYYTTKSSVFGGTIVTLTGTTEYNFLITFKEVEEEGATPECTIEERAAGYAEYYYKDADGTYYAPLLVLNETTDAPATLYAYTASRMFVKASQGTFVYNAETKQWLYTATDTFPAEDAIKEPWDLKKVTAFTCAIDSTTTSYQVNYWFSVTTSEGTKPLEKTYTATDGTTLTLVGGFAIYNENSNLITGVYYDRTDYFQIVTPTGNMFVELDGTAFTKLDYAPYSAYLMKKDGTITQDEYVTFDGKGGATYVIKSKTPGVEDTKYIGTFKKSDDKTFFFENDVYEFTATGKTFKYIQLSTGSVYCISLQNTEYQNEYTTAGVGVLRLDGYGFKASYTDANGVVHEGRYFFDKNNVLTIVVENEGNYYIDLTADAFSVRGSEYGDYAVIDNQYHDDLWIKLDGKGNLSLYEKDKEGNETPLSATNATYVRSGDEYTLSYTLNSQAVTLKGILQSNTFVCEHTEATRTYVNEKDWSVLILDDYGNAIKYNKGGDKQVGKYTLITSSLLYFVNNDGTDACLYEYNVATGVATAINSTEITYCTENLETLNFTKYGFAIFNGTDRRYYNVVNSNVIIYRLPKDGESVQPNAYGFVEEAFGLFDETKTYEEKTYYKTSGSTVTFTRETTTASQYPVNGNKLLTDLYFLPQGNGTFEVSGYVVLGGARQSCTVVRKLDKNDNVEMYVLVGNYRYDITVAYQGENLDGSSKNTYTVTGLRWMLAAPSYAYMDTYYMLYSFYGSSAAGYANNVGSIVLNREYDVDGNETSFYLTGEFGEGSKMYDVNGNVVSFDKATLDEGDDNGIYTAKFTKGDYVYFIRFQLANHPAFRVTGYRLYAFTRQETLPKTTDGYTVVVQKVIASETTIYKTGGVYSVALMHNETEIEADNLYLAADNVVYYVARTETGATYYTVTLTEEDLGSVGEASKIVPKYVSATITVTSVKTVYNEDKSSFVDLDETANAIKLIKFGEKTYVALSCEYDATSDAYTVVTTSGVTYKVTIAADKAVITEAE